jgi:hypothetical protein
VHIAEARDGNADLAEKEGTTMKLFAITVLTAGTLTIGTLGFAAAAAAASGPPTVDQTVGQPTSQGADTTVQQSSGNIQIVATPGQSAQNAAALQQPFGGDSASLIYHH